MIVRSLWNEVLAEAKTYSERQVPVVDLEAFCNACENMVSLPKLGHFVSEYSADQDEIIFAFLDLLPSSVDGLLEDVPDDRKKFDEQLAEVISWYGDKFMPDFEKVNNDSTTWLDNFATRLGAGEEGASGAMSELAKLFPISDFKLPCVTDKYFHVACALFNVQFYYCCFV